MNKTLILAFSAVLMSATMAFAATASPPTQGEPAMSATQSTYVGETVITKGMIEMNGTNVHPAVVTREFSRSTLADGTVTACVNLCILADTAHHVVPRTSMALYETEAAGDAATTQRDFVANGQTIKARPLFAYLRPTAARETQTVTTGDLTATLVGSSSVV